MRWFAAALLLGMTAAAAGLTLAGSPALGWAAWALAWLVLAAVIARGEPR